MSTNSGKLYVVATPIGNLADFSARGIAVLTQVDLIAAEDTRHVRMLLSHYGISNKLFSLHQYNEQKASAALLEKLRQGLSIALVSDAGTPLLSDPGMPLVKMAREAGIEVSPVPGACALIAALSVAGLPVSRFLFEGFLPRTGAARRAFFQERQDWRLTWVFYESSHRILAAIEDLAEVLPVQRGIVIARELTKVHETIVKDSLENVLTLLRQDENMRRGEFVVIVSAAQPEKNEAVISAEQKKLLTILLRECSTRTAAALAAEITGARKKDLYQAALALRKDR
ncbi:16S rRNA (cytidine(1402)-2'-O)-methyltransferase [Thiolapillus sp.]|uniref:16S rRNA (cytidine(1402)-2'-O)-methyltransferase n=1 Tax=Thiolapillus sp. TaxID=2017437 RepID=UPI003AF53023